MVKDINPFDQGVITGFINFGTLSKNFTMHTRFLFPYGFLFVLLVVAVQCKTSSEKKITDIKAFVGATLIDGTGSAAIDPAVMLVANGEIIAAGPSDSINIPPSAEIIQLEGKTIMPGIINTHGHIGGTTGLQSGYSKENVLRDLMLNAQYGITTVNSLGGDENESFDVRNSQDTLKKLSISRLYVAGDVITGNTPEEARALVDKNAARKANFIKIRVDDNLGTTEKMRPEIYEAIIDQAKKHNLPVAAHIFYLEDARAMLNLGVRFIAHSVRDKEVDEPFIELMKKSNAYYCPTLMREVSTFVYEGTPDFFNDPFFLRAADSTIINKLSDPARQARVKASKSAQAYKQALEVAKKNLKILADAGVKIAFGTDTGPPARFQGYFEHLELEQMVQAGLSPAQAIHAATGGAAEAIGQGQLGILKPGNKADFLVLEKNPLNDIGNTRSILSVWIGGGNIQE